MEKNAKPAIRELPLVQALGLDVELIDQYLAAVDKESKKVAAHENVGPDISWITSYTPGPLRRQKT